MKGLLCVFFFLIQISNNVFTQDTPLQPLPSDIEFLDITRDGHDKGFVVIKNMGCKTIKTIEWEFPYVYHPATYGLVSDGENNKILWQKQRGKKKIHPLQIASMRYSAPRERMQIYNYTALPHMLYYRPEHIIYRPRAFRITRIIYTSGPEWTAK